MGYLNNHSLKYVWISDKQLQVVSYIHVNSTHIWVHLFHSSNMHILLFFSSWSKTLDLWSGSSTPQNITEFITVQCFTEMISMAQLPHSYHRYDKVGWSEVDSWPCLIVFRLTSLVWENMPMRYWNQRDPSVQGCGLFFLRIHIISVVTSLDLSQQEGTFIVLTRTTEAFS